MGIAWTGCHTERWQKVSWRERPQLYSKVFSEYEGIVHEIFRYSEYKGKVEHGMAGKLGPPRTWTI